MSGLTVQERFVADGLKCKVLMGPVGSLNGYVAVDKNHPLYQKDYSWSYCGHQGCYQHTISMKVNVHGGLTYSGQGKEGEWWFGFDTSHSDDDPRFGGWTKDQSYVEAECRKLAKQLADWKPTAEPERGTRSE